MTYGPLLIGFVALATSCGVVWWSVRALDRPETPPPPAYDDQAIVRALDDQRLRLLEQQQNIEKLTLAISEGIDRVDRSERRVRAAVQRAQRRLADHGFTDDTLEAEASGLRALNGGDSEAEPVLPLPEEVEPAQNDIFPLSAVPGVFSAEEKSRMRSA